MEKEKLLKELKAIEEQEKAALLKKMKSVFDKFKDAKFLKLIENRGNGNSVRKIKTVKICKIKSVKFSEDNPSYPFQSQCDVISFYESQLANSMNISITENENTFIGIGEYEKESYKVIDKQEYERLKYKLSVIKKQSQNSLNDLLIEK